MGNLGFTGATDKATIKAMSPDYANWANAVDEIGDKWKALDLRGLPNRVAGIVAGQSGLREPAKDAVTLGEIEDRLINARQVLLRDQETYRAELTVVARILFYLNPLARKLEDVRKELFRNRKSERAVSLANDVVGDDIVRIIGAAIRELEGYADSRLASKAAKASWTGSDKQRKATALLREAMRLAEHGAQAFSAGSDEANQYLVHIKGALEQVVTLNQGTDINPHDAAEIKRALADLQEIGNELYSAGLRGAYSQGVGEWAAKRLQALRARINSTVY